MCVALPDNFIQELSVLVLSCLLRDDQVTVNDPTTFYRRAFPITRKAYEADSNHFVQCHASIDDTMFSLCTEDHQTDDDCREHGGGRGGTGWVQGGAGILGYRSLQHNR